MSLSNTTNVIARRLLLLLAAATASLLVLMCTSTSSSSTVGGVKANMVERHVANEADAACYEVGMNCSECLKKENCGFWQPEFDSCAASCHLEDATCYSNATSAAASNNNMTAEEICEEVANKEAHLACTAKTTCGGCVETSILSGSTTCQWFDEGQFCASGCGVDGCGKISCEADDDDNDESNGGSEEEMHPRHRQPALLLLPTGLHYFS